MGICEVIPTLNASEISRLTAEVFHHELPGEAKIEMKLPEPKGELVSLKEKVYVPTEPKEVRK